MEIITGQAVAQMCDYSFGDHAMLWTKNLQGTFKEANAHNQEFLDKAKGFEGKIMTLFIDNIRLYPRLVQTDTENDEKFVNYLMLTNNLLGLLSLLPHNGFIIFTGEEDTPIDGYIQNQLPFNVVKIYAVNAIFNNDKVIPFPFGLQRQIGENDKRLGIMEKIVSDQELERITLGWPKVEPSKLLYINCGIGRNKDREPLAKFETNDWVTTRFEKDSKFFPYNRYNEFLSELKDHKFVACPAGHAQSMDTHRIWETLYMRRVPIMKNHPYYKRLMQGFPVLFVDDWLHINQDLLNKNEDLYQQAQAMPMDKLDLTQLFKSAILKTEPSETPTT